MDEFAIYQSCCLRAAGAGGAGAGAGAGAVAVAGTVAIAGGILFIAVYARKHNIVLVLLITMVMIHLAAEQV